MRQLFACDASLHGSDREATAICPGISTGFERHPGGDPCWLLQGTADKQEPRLLAHPEVKAAIDAAKIQRSEQTGIDAEWVLRRLQEAALFAQAEINAIPEAIQPEEEHEMILWAIAPVERLASRLQLLEPLTKRGARMMTRTVAWLDGDGGSLDCLLEPMEIAA